VGKGLIGLIQSNKKISGGTLPHKLNIGRKERENAAFSPLISPNNGKNSNYGCLGTVYWK
jgi:hypothetical protein